MKTRLQELIKEIEQDNKFQTTLKETREIGEEFTRKEFIITYTVENK